MGLANTRERYGAVAKSFHWLSAILILGMLPCGFFLDDLKLYELHKNIGLLILLLTVLRLVWRLRSTIPTHSLPVLLRIASRLSHWAIYGAILCMTFSGWVMTTASGHIPHLFGVFAFPMPGIPNNLTLASTAFTLHGITAWILIGLISVHILAVLYHHWIRRDKVLVSMLPFS